MKIILIIILTFSVKNVFGQNQFIDCYLSVKEKTISIGETPEIKLIFENKTDSTIYLIKSLDASSNKWRYPYAYYTIQKLDSKDYKMEQYSRGGNMDGIDSTDFIKIKPKEKFDPIKYNHFYFSDYSVHDPNNFKNKGRYKITFHYSTESEYLGDYMGDDMNLDVYELVSIKGDSINPPQLINKIKKRYEEDIMNLENLFLKVPKTKLESNSIIIEVK